MSWSPGIPNVLSGNQFFSFLCLYFYRMLMWTQRFKHTEVFQSLAMCPYWYSHCPPFHPWKWLQIGSLVLLIRPCQSLRPLLISVWQGDSASSWIFTGPDLDSVISLRISGLFLWETVPNQNVHHMITHWYGLFPGLSDGQSWEIFMLTCIHVFTYSHKHFPFKFRTTRFLLGVYLSPKPPVSNTKQRCSERQGESQN